MKSRGDGMGEFLADHHLGHRSGGFAGRDAGGNDAAEAQDRRAVAERADLVELVRDIEDRHAFGFELPQRSEQLIHLLRREHRGRFVHDEELGVLQQAAHDLDALADAHGQVADHPVRVERQAVFGADGPDPLGQFAPRWRRLHAERDVLGDTHRLEEREMLEHHRDAGRTCRDRALRRIGRAVERHGAAVGSDKPVDHLDEGRLAGTVFAQQGMDLAAVDVEVDGIIGLHAGIGFRDVADIEERGHARRASGSSAARKRRSSPEM